MINSVIIVLITADERNDVFLPISGIICQTFLVGIIQFCQMAADAHIWAVEEAEGLFWNIITTDILGRL